MFQDLTILLAENEEITRYNLQEALSLLVKEVYVAKDGKEAYELYCEKKPDIIISDIEMPYITGLELAQKIREKDKTTQIIIVSAYTNLEYVIKAVELNLVKYIIKPISPTALKNGLSMARENILGLNNSIKIISNECQYDFRIRALMYNGIEQKLTFFQRNFLEYMLKASNRLVEYCELENNIWLEEGMSSDAIRSLVKGLRQKLPSNTIVNFSKLGYKLITI